MKIIAGFPGTGKTFFCCNHSKKIECIDINSKYMVRDKHGKLECWMIEKYVKSVQDAVKSGLYDFIFVSTHKETLKILIEKYQDDMSVIVPHTSLKMEYLCRYKERGSSDAYIKFMRKNWKKFVRQTAALDIKVHVLDTKMFVSHILWKWIKHDRHGN